MQVTIFTENFGTKISGDGILAIELYDTPENIELADKAFRRQMKRLDGLKADVAFFPVDERLGSSQEMGAIEFAERTDVKSFVAMHRVGYPRWQPSENFFKSGKIIPTWSPVNPGESIEL